MSTDADDDSLAGAALSPWDEALIAAAVFAVDPQGVGGIRVRALPGPVRERWQAYVSGLLPTPPRRVPIGITDDRLLGGLDLPATLQTGRPVARIGLLAESDGGVLLLAMAERVEPGVAARLSATLDTGEVVAEREGLTLRAPARLGVIAFDESGGDDDERMDEGLLDRLGLHLDLSALGHRDAEETEADGEAIVAARALLPQVGVPEDAIEALVTTAVALGVYSLRPPLQALKVARCAAALDGRTEVDKEDVVRSGWYFRLMRRRDGGPLWSGIAPGCALPHTNPARDALHTLERQAEQLAEAGVPEAQPPALPDLSWCRTPVPAALAAPPTARLALLVPGAAPHRPAKRWPAARYAALAVALARDGLLPVVLGTSAEAKAARVILDACPEARDLTGQTSLLDLAALGRQAALAVGNDTGPMHLLAATGCPALVLFSAASDPTLCAPRGPRVRVFRAETLETVAFEPIYVEALDALVS